MVLCSALLINLVCLLTNVFFKKHLVRGLDGQSVTQRPVDNINDANARQLDHVAKMIYLKFGRVPPRAILILKSVKVRHPAIYSCHIYCINDIIRMMAVIHHCCECGDIIAIMQVHDCNDQTGLSFVFIRVIIIIIIHHIFLVFPSVM